MSAENNVPVGLTGTAAVWCVVLKIFNVKEDTPTWAQGSGAFDVVQFRFFVFLLSSPTSVRRNIIKQRPSQPHHSRQTRIGTSLTEVKFPYGNRGGGRRVLTFPSGSIV